MYYFSTFNLNIMTTVVKATTKGQITLPIFWRRRFKTNQFLIREKKDGLLEISPLDLEKASQEKEYTVFDAIRDNQGKGIKAKDLVKALKKTL